MCPDCERGLDSLSAFVGCWCGFCLGVAICVISSMFTLVLK